MAEFLIKSDSETAAQRYWRGDIINVYEDGRITEPPASGMVVVKVPGLDVPTAELQNEEWWFRLGFTILTSDLPNDTFTIKAEATEYNPNSGVGKLTQGKIENFLQKWGATGISFASSAVTFSIKILDAIKSTGFWGGADVTGLTLNEISYTQATGTHRCRVNYTNSALTAQQLKDAIAQVGATFVSENIGNKTITFDVTRQNVQDQFYADVKRRTEGMIVRRKYHISEAAMTAIEAAGGYVTVSLAEYNTYWKNKLTE